MRSREYAADVVAQSRRPKPPPPEVPADAGLVVEEVGTGWCGAVVECDKERVSLEDRRGKVRVFPLERGGFLLGLRVPQIVGFAVAGLIGLGFLHSAGFAGLLLAFATVAAAGAILMVPVRGHTIEEWTPLAVRFLVGHFSRRTRFRA